MNSASSPSVLARSAGAAACRSVSPAANPWLARTAILTQVTPETPGVATYHFRFARPDDAAGYDARPGQFNMLYLPGIGETPISVSGRDAANGTWLHTIRTAGNATRAIERMRPGETLGLRGPFGTAWPLEESRGLDVLLVAGGIGLAPLRPAIRALLQRQGEFGQTTVIHGARSPEGLLFANEYADWNRAGLRVETTVDRGSFGWTGNIGVATLAIDRLHPFDAERTTVWMCGPEVMLRYAVKSALARGVAPDRIYVSLERNMQCAVGLCGHCQLGPAFVCKDGPVFRYDKMAPFLRVENF